MLIQQTPQNAIEALRASELFYPLRGDLLAELAAAAVVRSLERGQVLFEAHQETSHLYVVAQGALRSVQVDRHGREQVLSVGHRGSIIGLAPLFDGGKNYSKTIADERSDVLCISKQNFQRLCRQHTEISWCAARALARTIRGYAGLVETLSLRLVEQRVAEYIVSVASREGIDTPHGCTVKLTLTQEQIASRIGSVREVVSRVFTHLEKINLIQKASAHTVSIPDMSALEAFASGSRPLARAAQSGK